MAGILARCRGVARRSPEAERHTVAGIGVAGIGVATIGAAGIGAATIGVVTIGVAIGAITDLPVISSSSLAILVIRSSTGIPLTDIIRTTTTATAMVTPTGMIIMAGPLTDTVTATAIKDTAMAIKDTAMAIKDTAMAIDPGSRSCRGASRGLATTAAPLMESWDRKPGAPFALTNVRMVN